MNPQDTLHHPNLVRHLGSRLWPEDDPRFLCVKLEMIEGPTLEQWGHERGRNTLKLWSQEDSGRVELFDGVTFP